MVVITPIYNIRPYYFTTLNLNTSLPWLGSGAGELEVHRPDEDAAIPAQGSVACQKLQLITRLEVHVC